MAQAMMIGQGIPAGAKKNQELIMDGWIHGIHGTKVNSG